jgi:hypothetical protein
MAERIFKYYDTGDLIAQVTELGQLITSGSGPTNALKNSSTGFLKETGAVSQQQLRNYFMLGRYEIYLRGRGVDGKPPDDICANYEATDPFQERRMRVQSSFQKWPGGPNGWWNQF